MDDNETILAIIRRQVLFVSALVSALTIAVLLFQNSAEQRRQERAEVEQRIQSTAFLISSLMQVADFATTEQVVETIAADANIEAIWVESTAGNQIVFAGNRPPADAGQDASLEEFSFEITSKHNPDRKIGRTVYIAKFGLRSGLSASPVILAPVLLVFFGVVFLLSWRLKGKVVQPLRRVFEAAKNSDNNNWPLEDPGGPLEIRELNKALKQMMASIAQRNQALDAANKELVHEIEEKQKAQEALIRATKYESIGRLAGGIAHDFNNLLAIILGNLELSMVSGKLPKKLEKFINTAFSATLSGSELTKNMMTFAGRGEFKIETLSFEKLISKLRAMTRHAIPPAINVQFDVRENLWPIKADFSSVENAILNLILNARDAIEGEGKITVAARNCTLKKRKIFDAEQNQILPGKYMLLTVTDNGAGIVPEHLSEIFEPYFTTKGADKGTGLGLAMILGVVKKFDGHVCVESTPGKGTQFSLYFRATEAVEKEVEKSELSIEDFSFSGRQILLVEDQNLVREALGEILHQYGANVSQVQNGQEALKTLFSNPGIDLVISDMAMPGPIQGADIANWISQVRPELPLILISGSFDEKVMTGLHLPLHNACLSKPVSARALVSKAGALMMVRKRKHSASGLH